ncbi:MAG TPA: glycosyltransferase family 2 protein [Anaerolineae bacterium]|nr:glycosyltransferase family 2 protein [Anaerolineae bacterium]
MISEATCAVILNWNRREETLACLASVTCMVPAPGRIILVDNASTDGSVEAVAAAYPGVDVVRNEANLGFAGGMNVGLRAALEGGASYILALNNDTLVSPHLLARLTDGFSGTPNAGMVVPKIYYADPPDRIWYAGAMRRRWFPGFDFPGYGKRDAPRYNRPRQVDYATGCGLLVRASVLETVGLLDETTFFMYHEDLDLSERVRRAGYRIVFKPDARMWHVESASTAPDAPVKWYYLSRYIVPFFRRYYRLPAVSLTLYTLYVVVRELLKGKPRHVAPFLHGIRDGLRHGEATDGIDGG